MRLRHPAIAVLAEPNFRRFFVGNATSLLGDGMVLVALSFAVLDLTGSPADLGYVLSARSVPMLAALILGGVIADRFPRRRVMVAADLARCLGQGTAAVLLISGHATIWELVVLQAVHGTATGIFNPAVTGLVPAIAAGDRLQQANALRGLAISVGNIVGPALAGAAVAVTNPGWAIGADAATFAISAVQLARLDLPAHTIPRTQSFLRDLREGWDELRSRVWLWTFVSFSSIGNMCYAAFLVLGPAVSRQSSDGPILWATLLSALAVGSVAGGIASLHVRPRRPLRTAALGSVLFAAPTLGLAAQLPMIVMVVPCLLAGAGTTLANALSETTLQNHIEDRRLSRISAFQWFGSLAVQPIGQASTGPLSGAIGIYPTLWIAGSGTLLSALARLAVPAIRNLPARPCLPADPPRSECDSVMETLNSS